MASELYFMRVRGIALMARGILKIEGNKEN